ncbi:GNAT family N-acetyltransferase [Candidimonas sp. SYP-B2681]|nr:GNAT family N-acetyltransferase [Candidimonas sp. SYP-B2681]
MITRKQIYGRLCAEEPSIPIFSRDWWLDATAGSNDWDVALVKEKENVLACMPYLRKKKGYLNISTAPPLTYCMGPWTRPSKAKPSAALSKQKYALEKLIEQLPPFDHFKQEWHHSQTNWLPFYWQGYNQTTNYTYLLPLLRNESALWDGLQDKVRWEIRKAASRSGLQVRDDLPVTQFLRLHKLVYQRQNKSLPYSENYITTLDKACATRKQRKIFMAQDEHGVLHAGVYLVWDDESAYYLMGGSDPERRSSGAMSLCLWEAIKFAGTVTQRFDFCGSMVQPIERFVRAFGGVQTPYFTVSKTPSPLAATFLFARSLVQTLR